jgi:sulfiredoxin
LARLAAASLFATKVSSPGSRLFKQWVFLQQSAAFGLVRARSAPAGRQECAVIAVFGALIIVVLESRDHNKADEIATSMLDKGQQAPILVRADGARFVLVEGLHRLEAAKALGEKTIFCFLVEARKH